MDMQKSTLSRVEETIRSSYRQIFAIDEPAVEMPQNQVNLFAERALQQHMMVGVTFRNQEHSVVGRFTHQLNASTYLLHDQAKNLDQLVPLAQCTFIQRLD
ncbi:hypothetical protein [Lacticaseibacillus sharpeae]|uniref:YolD-like protein n=1 Tax=Lacticaseibacillus sharpeae JCM 1186 = DSM 20505 TaxID=1291052 RepID=A0A0R1ZP71_9LACO|nr:hypothetical protein [Lacticaseibacillus sharpeae]KRM56351.1 hypothetical protein FC18_GL000034 [Lacticaseibacillus sharpeae JCM 1186 = DSM 20505]